MADAEKKSKTEKIVAASSGLAASLSESVDVLAPVIEEGTILRIVTPVKPREEGDTDRLTYAALYVNGKWYMTGDGRGPLATMYVSTTDLLIGIARVAGARIELATAYDIVR